MIAEFAMTVVCVVAAWGLISLFKGWSWYWYWYWSWKSYPWRPRFSAVGQSSHPRPTATLSSRCAAQSLQRERRCSELNEADLKVLISHIEGSDGGPPWKLMMEHSTPTLTYQAWYRDPPLGPTQYRTRTVFENVSPELLRDFFWDDEFRPSWDNMLIYFQTLNVCHQSGTMTVHWIRKLPLFCSDREYVITRRIWQSESGYYCLTKGTPYPSLPSYQRSRRVDNYYSSWHIRSVKPRNGGQQNASEVVLFHHEDIGLPREVVKMAVRARMWSMVKKMHLGVQMYSSAKAKNGSPSIYALMANTTTGVSPSTTQNLITQFTS